MSRYIDADIIQKEISVLCEQYNIAYGKEIPNGFGKELSTITDKVPTADVQEVRHSHWQYYGYIGDSNYFKCCNCGEIRKEDTNYCPNCGAKMEEG